MTPTPSTPRSRTVVVGPGIVGMPMAALLADATRRLDATPGEVVVVQRNSPTSGWKVDAINRGESPIGGVEPALDDLVATNAAAGTLRATHGYDVVADADTILVCVQTDKRGLAPDYGPLFEALHGIAAVLASAPRHRQPLLIIESTLAPSTMASVIAPLFAAYGLHEGIDLHLGNSPNRVMPGRLVDRVASADKLVGALSPATAGRIAQLYGRIVSRGRLWQTSSMAAEVVKTLENAYRDVRIAFAAELVRWCDAHDIDFYRLRDLVNRRLERCDSATLDGTAVPTGAILVPTVGVGGHCLPKDGILLWWRALEAGAPSAHSLILAARTINDESPSCTLALARRHPAGLAGTRVAVLGAAYRAESEDTRNSPALALAQLLVRDGAIVSLHDPFVRPGDANLKAAGLQDHLTSSLEHALRDATIVVVAVAHAMYRTLPHHLAGAAPHGQLVVDAANLYRRSEFVGSPVRYEGLGRGQHEPSPALVETVLAQFRALEQGVANEVGELVDSLNHAYPSPTPVTYEDVQRMARTCATGCDLADRGPVDGWTGASFRSHLATIARERWGVPATPQGLASPRRAGAGV